MKRLLAEKLFNNLESDRGHMQLLVSEALCMTPASLVEKLEDATLSAVTRLYTSMGGFFTRNAPIDDDGYDYDAEIKRGLGAMSTRISAQVSQQFATFAEQSMDNILSIDTGLVRNGFVRLPQNEGIDYRDPKKASSLAEDVIHAEDALATSYREKRDLRETLRDLEAAEAELDEVLQNLGDNLSAKLFHLKSEHAEMRDLASDCAKSMLGTRHSNARTPLDDWELENEGEINIRLA